MPGGRRADSASSDVLKSLDIEGIIQKMVEAASTVLRNEFIKILENISAKVVELEKKLNDHNELDDGLKAV